MCNFHDIFYATISATKLFITDDVEISTNDDDDDEDDDDDDDDNDDYKEHFKDSSEQFI